MYHQQELLAAFNMNEDDLALNRMGQLSATQLSYLHEFQFWKITEDLLFALIVLTPFLGCFPLTAFVLLAVLDLHFALVAVIMGLVLILLARYWRKLPFMNRSERSYSLKIWEGQRRVPDFQVNYIEASTKPNDALNILQPNRRYRFYYVELNLPLVRDRVVVLGAEDLENFQNQLAF